MGQLLALYLINEGWHVTLFEQHDAASHHFNCSNAAAGLLSPYCELDKSPVIISQMGMDALRFYWPAVLQQLGENVYFRQLGSLVIHHPRDQAEWFHFSRRIENKTGQNNSQPVAAAHLEPELAKFDQAYYFPDEAQIDSQHLLQVLESWLRRQNTEWHFSSQVSDVNNGKISTTQHTREFDWVFDCRGLGADSAFPSLRGIRGELIWLHAPEVRLQRPVRLLHPRYNLYLVPRPNRIYLLGASEIEAEDFSPISLQTTLELLTAAYYVHAGFSEARLLKTVTQCRPVLSDHLPCIQYNERTVAVNGLYRHGYLIAPTLAAEVVRWIKHGRTAQNYPSIWRPYQ